MVLAIRKLVLYNLGDDNYYHAEEKNSSKPTSPVSKTRRLSQTSGISAASRNSQRKSSLNRRLSQTSGISAVSKHSKSSLSKTPGSFLNHALYQDSFNTEQPPSNPIPRSRLDNGLKSKTPKSKLSTHAHHKKNSTRRMSKTAPLLNTTSYYHGDFIDENLLISATKLDSTLIRLFSQTRDKHNDLENRASDDKLIPYLNYLESDLISMDAVLWRVHPMEAAHKETLEQELPFIEGNIQPREVIRDLYQDEILTHMDFTQFTRTEGQGERAVNRLLVKTLQRRGDKAYPAFVGVLKKLDYTHVCDRLRDTEAVIRQGMKDDGSDLARRMEEENLRHLHRQMAPNTPFTVINTPGYDSDTDETHRPQAYTPQTVPATTELAVDQTQLDSHVMDSKVLEQHLRDLSAELQALQHDVSALRTLQESRTSEDLTLKVDADLDSQTPEVETPEANITVDEKSKSQKSGSCSIL
ncbi:uncharacterized protein LOC131952079 [Physella acuta]|uniref:uncharacterized protein LOC131952079 n=1 Tax=Physella acuta TaxID=109671 RepID=UPI0027DAC06D|nr:uncharacterized protein LOC131952079 [Physella acuta]